MDITDLEEFIIQPLIVLPAAIGSLLVFMGLVLNAFPPKNINHFYGYRTKTSRASKRRWKFAQIYSSKEMMKTGILYLMTIVLAFFYDPQAIIAVIISCGILILLMVMMVIRVEAALKKEFGEL